MNTRTYFETVGQYYIPVQYVLRSCFEHSTNSLANHPIQVVIQLRRSKRRRHVTKTVHDLASPGTHAEPH